MTGEEIRDFLDLEETFTSGDVQKAYSQRLEKEKQALANGGSRAERMMAREKLSRLERIQGDVTLLVTRMRAAEEVNKYLPKASAHVKAGNFKLADVSFKYIRKVPADLLPEDLQMAVEEMAARIEEGLAGSAAAEAEAARKAAEAEKARAEEAARIEAEKASAEREEKARLAREEEEPSRGVVLEDDRAIVQHLHRPREGDHALGPLGLRSCAGGQQERAKEGRESHSSSRRGTGPGSAAPPAATTPHDTGPAHLRRTSPTVPGSSSRAISPKAARFRQSPDSI